MTKHRTSKGIPFDMDTIRMQNENVIAAGNVPLNARGDIIGEGGRVIKKAEELTREFYANQQSQVNTNAKLKQPIEETITDLTNEIAPAPVKQEKKKKSEIKEETVVTGPPTLTKEVVLSNGDIVVVDADQDPSGDIL